MNTSTPSFTLIHGQYVPLEAKEVLLSLISSKINFNQMKAFGVQERFNGDVSHYQTRVTQLKTVREQVLQLIEEAIAGGYELKVEGAFTIELVPAAPTASPEPSALQTRSANGTIEYYLA